MNEIEITMENFEAEVKNCKDMPVLLDFWASWCGPCSMLSPIISEIADELDGTVKVGKVNVDEQPQLAAQFNVDSIPLVVVMKNGEIVNEAVGFRPKEQILEMLK